MNKTVLTGLLLFAILLTPSFTQTTILDSFDSLEDWKIIKSEGVEVKIALVDGIKGKALKFEYEFVSGAGYCGIQKKFPLNLSGNFRFSYFVKAESPSNNFEFKLIDKSGDNVWWTNKRNYEFPLHWQKNSVKRRNIEFAWGPINDKTLKETEKIEFTVASFVGGKGTVYLDELVFEELPENPVMNNTPVIIADSKEIQSSSFYDNNAETIWTPETQKPVEIVFDFRQLKEFGGIECIWGNSRPEKVEISISEDNKSYYKIADAKNIKLSRTYFYLPESESRFIKIRITQAVNKKTEIKEIKLLPVEFSLTKNAFISNIASKQMRGIYPRYFYNEKSYWNVIGVDTDEKEALINEDGMIEVDKLSFSLEPFIETGDKFICWDNSSLEQGLEKEYLPIPIVKRVSNETELTIQAFASGTANKNSTLYIKYKLKNLSNKDITGTFHIAIRPYQVNPSYQFLNTSGGVSGIKSIEKKGNKIHVDEKVIFSSSAKYTLSLSEMNAGDVVEQLLHKSLVKREQITDSRKMASGLMSFDFKLEVGKSEEFVLAVPFYGTHTDFSSKEFSQNPRKVFNEKLAKTVKEWDAKINRISFSVPDELKQIINIIRANTGYILINKDNYGTQPGSRSYERSWIRDGSLTSTAMMKMGYTDEVKNFIKWYSSYQFPNGKIPCVVDRRGADPVPEHDSHGEFIFLVKNYFNFTKDTAFLKEIYPKVKGAVEYLNSLIAERSTDYYKNGNDSIRAYYGILTESISHEGYSDKPRHSYWDNFFAMKGFEDALRIAEIINAKDDIPFLLKTRDTFKKNLYQSLELAIKTRNIDYIPGCVELGDFDATSTTIALYPCNQKEFLPQDKLYNTFSKYYTFFTSRKNNTIDWVNYTPYENRIIGSFILLGEIGKAYDLIDYFIKDQRPRGWKHWAEVVWRNERLPRFIGDMPHTWCGSDFINSARMLFAYEDEIHNQLVICAGVKAEMLNKQAVVIENLPTHFGNISYAVEKNGKNIAIKVWGDKFTIPSGGIKIATVINQNNGKIFSGSDKIQFENGVPVIKEFPAKIEFEVIN